MPASFLTSSCYLTICRSCLRLPSLGIHSVTLTVHRLPSLLNTWPTHVNIFFLTSIITSGLPDCLLTRPAVFLSINVLAVFMKHNEILMWLPLNANNLRSIQDTAEVSKDRQVTATMCDTIAATAIVVRDGSGKQGCKPCVKSAFHWSVVMGIRLCYNKEHI